MARRSTRFVTALSDRRPICSVPPRTFRRSQKSHPGCAAGNSSAGADGVYARRCARCRLTAHISLTIVRDMDEQAIQQVRRFNRIVAERIGALDDRFLGRVRPMGESRTLWEIGAGGTEVREL